MAKTSRKKKSVSKNLKLLAAIVESILAVPILGGLLVIAMVWMPLLAMLVVHIFGIIYASKEKRSIVGHCFGIGASLLGWIPFIGFIFHFVSAIILWIEFVKIK